MKRSMNLVSEENLGARIFKATFLSIVSWYASQTSPIDPLPSFSIISKSPNFNPFTKPGIGMIISFLQEGQFVDSPHKESSDFTDLEHSGHWKLISAISFIYPHIRFYITCLPLPQQFINSNLPHIDFIILEINLASIKLDKNKGINYVY